MKILVTGSRSWTDAFFVQTVIQGLVTGRTEEHLLIHGAARGADSLAAVCGETYGVEVRAFPADWGRYGRSAGPIRNNQMLDERPDLVLAFSDDLVNSKGTRHCVSEARKRDIPVWVLSHA